MGVIFDLDNTLINSSTAYQLRKKRLWEEVYKVIPNFFLYDEILKILNFLNNKNIELVIVTSSPRSYCKKVIEHFNIPVNNLICYHDTINHKPNPEPIIKAIEKYLNSEKMIFSFGDDIKDIEASNYAKIYSVACLWGSTNQEILKNSNANFICKTPQDMFSLLKKHVEFL